MKIEEKRKSLRRKTKKETDVFKETIKNIWRIYRNKQKSNFKETEYLKINK